MIFFAKLMGEGSRTISPTITSSTALLIQPNLSVGSFLNCPSDNRIHFVINDFASEKLYYGFNWMSYSKINPQLLTNMYMRVYNPQGIQEGDPIKLSSSGSGFIATQGSSVIGPRIGLVNLSGYTPAIFSPTTNGEYSIEVYQSNDLGQTQFMSADSACWSVSPYFDLTVATANGTIAKGRVFSKKWAFQPVVPTTFKALETAGVESIVYPYTNEGCVFQVAFQEGFRPGSLVLCANGYGISDVGDWLESRKSKNSQSLPNFSEGYRVFLNQPDRTVFPYATSAQSPTFDTPALSGQFPGPYKIRFNVFKKGDCAISLDIDETPGFQPYGQDIRVELPDCPEGLNEWVWNGRDGKGDLLIKDQLFTVYIDYKQYRTNLPLYDAEINSRGFAVGCLAPAYTERIKLYWDDSELTSIGSDRNIDSNNITSGGSKNTVSGVLSPTRAWSGNANTGNEMPAPVIFGNESDGLPATDYGNSRVLNSWFYSSEYQMNMSFGSKKITLYGTVWNDVDNSASGSFSNIESIGETGANADVYVYAIDTTTNHVLSGTALSSNGTFVLKGVPINKTGILLLLSDELKSSGDTIPSIALPRDWLNTSPISRYFNTGDVSVRDLDFGIQRKPIEGNSVEIKTDKPENEKFILLPDTLFNGQDFDGGMVFFIHLTAFPKNVKTLAVDNFKYTQANFPADGVYILTDMLGNSISDISVDPIGTFQDSVKIFYRVIDNGSAESDNEAVVSLVFNAEADLSVVKSVDQTRPLSGKSVIFTVLAKNRGPIDAKAVVVNDLLPSGYSYVSHTANKGVYSSSTGIWSIGDFANGDSAQLVVTCKVKTIGDFTNTAVISGSMPDNVSINNRSSVSTEPLVLTDLSIIKSVNKDNPIVGDTINFKLIASNEGPLDATSVVVKDLLPKGYTFVNYKTSRGLYNKTTGEWNLGELLIGATDTLIMSCVVNSNKDYDNIATIAGEQSDLLLINNTSTVTPNSLKIADLSITKTIDKSNPSFGSRVEFTILARNLGPNSATNVVAKDSLYSGFKFVSASASIGEYNPSTGIWSIGSLANGATATLKISCIVLPSGDFSNRASITASEDDSQLSNNESTIVAKPTTPVVFADLRVVKSVDRLKPQIGSRVQFTIVASNLGSANATGVVVSDLLPSGYSYENSTVTQGLYSPSSGEWLVGALNNGDKATLKVSAIVLPTGEYRNQALISALQSDNNLTNNSSSITPIPVLPISNTDLQISKSVDKLTPTVGDKVRFTINASNNGPDNATGVEVTELIPSGYQYLGFSASQGVYSESLGKWSVGSLSNGAKATIGIDCKVLESGVYQNVASISGLETDNLLSNNEATATTTPVNPIVVADLSITKIVNNESPAIGSRIEFSIVLSNNGSSNATNINVLDTIPSGYQYLGYSSSNGVYDPESGLWTIDKLDNGATELLKIDCLVLPVGDYKNNASVVAKQIDNDLANNYYSVTTTPKTPNQEVDLRVEKTVDNLSPKVGDVVKFTIKVENIGATNSTGVEVIDVLPDGYTYVSASASQSSYSDQTGKWIVGFLKAGQIETLTIDAVVKSKGTYKNKVVVSALESDIDFSNNSAEVTPNVVVEADLAITKTVNVNSPVVGSRVEFTITATNKGGSDASNVKVIDLLPSGYRYVSSTLSQGNYIDSSGEWMVGSLISGGSVTLKLICIVASNGDYTNNATISGSEFDKDLSNNVASVATNPLAPVSATDLKIAKSVNIVNPTVGSRIKFTLVATNDGPKDATGVEVSDILPTGFQFISASGRKGNYSIANGRWNIGNMINGESDTLTIECHVLSSGDYVNIAYISGLESDNILANNVSIVSISPVSSAQNTDLSVVKSIDNSSPIIGGRVEFTIVARNNGPNDATGVIVSDVIPSGYKYVSSSASRGNYSNSDGEWIIGDLDNSASASLRITCITQSSGTYTNVAYISGLETDNQLQNNVSIVEATPVSSSVETDLSITKTIDNLTPFYGDTVTFTIKVTNLGPNDATGVEIYDEIPSGYQYIDYTSTSGSFLEALSEWGIGNLANGANATLKLRCVVLENGNYLNTAIATGSESDANILNNESTIASNPSKLIPIADLSVTKTVSNQTPVVGSRITFTIVAKNNGKWDATGVKVNELLPSGYKFSGATATQGNYSEEGLWTIGSLPNGAEVTLRIECIVQPNGEYTNVATISGNEFDNVVSNNGSAATTSPTSPIIVTDLKVIKTVDNETPTIGSRVVFTIEAINNGPDNATGVVVADLLPSGYRFISARSSIGAYDEIQGKWDIGSMANGDSAKLVVETIVLENGIYRNVAYISGLNSDNVLSNNVSLALTVPSAPILKTDLSIVKTIDNQTPKIGGRVVFSIVAKNNGPSDASGIVVSDLLPNGYQFVNAAETLGDYNEITGTWSIGSLKNGADAELKITCIVLPSNNYTNLATITGLESDTNLSNNASAVSASPVSSSIFADLALTQVVDNSYPKYGEVVEFSIELANKGNNNATGVLATDALPSGFRYVSYSATKGVYDPTKGDWIVGNLANGEKINLKIKGEVIRNGSYTNKIFVTGFETDDDLSNNMSFLELIIDQVPNAFDDYFEVSVNGILNEIVSANDSLSLDGGNTFSVSLSPKHGNLDLAMDGTFVYKPALDFVGSDEFVYKLVDIDGDASTAKVTISIADRISVPEGFSPNGDNVNDELTIPDIDKYPNNRFVVFNRWGNKVYEAAPYSNSKKWNGEGSQGFSFGGNRLPAGVYYYILDLGNGQPPKKSFFYLNR